MDLMISIPEEFIKDYNDTGFSECFERVVRDLKSNLYQQRAICAGNYEIETLEMLQNAFSNAISVSRKNSDFKLSDNLWSVILELAEQLSEAFVPYDIETKEIVLHEVYTVRGISFKIFDEAGNFIDQINCMEKDDFDSMRKSLDNVKRMICNKLKLDLDDLNTDQVCQVQHHR